MLAALTCELGYEPTDAEMRRRLKSILTDARYSTFIAEMGGVVCGMIGTLTHASHEHNDLSEKIIALVVSKKQRRSGIGRALIAAAEKDFCREKSRASDLNDAIHTQRSALLLRGARLRTKRMAICETTFGEQFICNLASLERSFNHGDCIGRHSKGQAG